jgi:hypothetical protein
MSRAQGEGANGGQLRLWIDTHRDQAIVVLSLIVGLRLMGDNSYLIAT